MLSSGTKELFALLTSLFAADELRRFAAFLPHGDLTPLLPSAPASLNEIAFGMVQALERHGWIDDEFFVRLEEERPGRRDESARLRAMLLDATPKPSDIIDFTGERGRHKHFFGREDILRELDEWLRGRGSGWLLLTGSSGLGKSAIFHHWLGLREQAGLPVAFHFIRRGIHNWAEPQWCARVWLRRSSGTSPSSATPAPIPRSGWSNYFAGSAPCSNSAGKSSCCSSMVSTRS